VYGLLQAVVSACENPQRSQVVSAQRGLVGRSSVRSQAFAVAGRSNRSGSGGRPEARVLRNDCPRCSGSGASAAAKRSAAGSFATTTLPGPTHMTEAYAVRIVWRTTT